MCMSINARAIRQSIFGGNAGRATPRNKVGFYLVSSSMSTDRTISPMSANAHMLFISHYSISPRLKERKVDIGINSVDSRFSRSTPHLRLGIKVTIIPIG